MPTVTLSMVGLCWKPHRATTRSSGTSELLPVLLLLLPSISETTSNQMYMCMGARQPHSSRLLERFVSEAAGAWMANANGSAGIAESL